MDTARDRSASDSASSDAADSAGETEAGASQDRPMERVLAEPIEALAHPRGDGPARGEPSPPQAFRWRGEVHHVASIGDRVKRTGPCRNGSDDRYLRAHVVQVTTKGGWRFELHGLHTVRRGQPRWVVHRAGRTGQAPANTDHGAPRQP